MFLYVVLLVNKYHYWLVWKEGVSTFVDWFQPEMSTFFTRNLIIWYHKTGMQISYLNFNCFQKSNRPVQNLIVQFCTGIFYLFTIYSSVAKGVPVSVFWFFGFFPKSQFFNFTSQKISRFGGKYLCRPLSNRGSIKYIFSSSITFSIISIFSSDIPSKSHNFNIWQKTLLIPLWPIEQKATLHEY